MTDFDPVDLALGSGKILTASNFGPVVATAQHRASHEIGQVESKQKGWQAIT